MSKEEEEEKRREALWYVQRHTGAGRRTSKVPPIVFYGLAQVGLEGLRRLRARLDSGVKPLLTGAVLSNSNSGTTYG